MNEHIAKNLENYLSLDEPQYAILLTGEWGSGKTYFIDTFIENKDTDDRKFIKVSLFGKSCIEEVNQLLIIQLLGVNEKLGKIGSKVFDKLGGRFGLSVRDLPLNTLIKKNKKFIFVLDDLERSNIDLKSLLGYINELVEIQKYKVILLADDTQIKDENYVGFKEKVIGKTFKVTHDFDSVFALFLDIASKSKHILVKNKETIHTLFDKAGYKNLRHLRQAIMDFEYLYGHIDETYIKHDVFMRELVTIFFALSFEIKKGSLTQSSFGQRENHVLKAKKVFDNQITEQEQEEETKPLFEKIILKYSLYELFFTSETWIDILYRGKIEKAVLSREISHTSYFLDETSPTWERLWSVISIEDDEFQYLLEDVEARFEANEYVAHGELLHVTALLLLLSGKRLYEKEASAILIQARKNVDMCMQEALWKKEIYSYFKHLKSYSKGLSCDKKCKHYEDFLEFEDYLKGKSQEAYFNDLMQKSEGLLNDLDNFDILNELLYKTYHNIPIFSKMNVDNFIDKLIDIKHGDMKLYSIIRIFSDRYEDYKLENSNLFAELSFWKKVDAKILIKIDKTKNPITYYLLEEDFKNDVLKNIILNLENKKKGQVRKDR